MHQTGIVELLILGVVIGANNFAAALALGALGQAARRWRVVAVFGAFEFTIPLLGMWLGQRASGWLAGQFGWLSWALLAMLGGWAVREGLRHRADDERLARRVTTWRGLGGLAAGLSVDNLIIGFGLGLTRLSPLSVATTIAVFSMGFSWLGMRLGCQARRHWEKWAKVGSGALLLALAIAMWRGWI